MDTIIVSHLRKYYSVHKKEPGLWKSLRSLVKRKYETVRAIDDINFRIGEGELIAFIGPNGAGKTTALKCLSGLLYPDSGFVSVLGYTPWDRKPAFLKEIAFVMGQKGQLWWDLPPMETFLLNKEIYEIPPPQFRQTLDELTELLEVADILKIQTRKLSLGQRMKCELIASLLHRPKVLFLDEPTIGLDVVMQKKIRDFIKSYNQKYHSTIILTSHYMSDVRELAKRVVVIDKGEIIFDGRLVEIVEKYTDHKLISVIFSKKIDKRELKRIGRIKKFSYPRAVVIVRKQLASLAAAELLKSFPVEDLKIEEPAIEDVIRALFTGKNSAE